VERLEGSGSKTDPLDGTIKIYEQDIRLVRELAGTYCPVPRHDPQGFLRVTVRDHPASSAGDAGHFVHVPIS
jgi:hypothetical protein